MKIKLSIAAALMLLSLTCVRAAGTNDAQAELKDLVSKVQAKLTAGEVTPAALAPELKQFDVLLAEHQGEKTEDTAKILFMKAKLYEEVFHDTTTSDELTQQLVKDFPDTKLAATVKAQIGPLTGSTFPDFSEKDLNGKPLSVAGIKGKVVLVDFWATWCGPCRAELPNVVAAYKKYHAKGFEIIGVSLDGNRPPLDTFLKENTDEPWPQFFEASSDGTPQNWSNKLALKYGIQRIPSSFLIDGSGKIIARNLRGDQLAGAVAKAVSAN